jgi:transcriptional regulator with XRE-family HTH domain
LDTPPLPPEASLIGVAREAARLTIPEAARRARISKARWSQVESGRDGDKIARAKPGTLARMAHVTGITPEDLRTVERADAAKVLEEILRRELPAPVAPAGQYSDGAQPPQPDAASLARFSPEMLERMRPHLATIGVRVESARRARVAAALDPADASGTEVFPDSPEDAISWDNLARRLPASMHDLLPVMLAELLALEELRDNRQQQDDEVPGSALRRG